MLPRVSSTRVPILTECGRTVDSTRPHPHALRAVLGLATPILGLTHRLPIARARFAAAFTAMRLLWLMTSVVSAPPPVRGRLTGHELRAAGGGLERAARRLQGLQHEVAHLEEHAPLPGHQPHVPGLHKRTRLPAGSQKRQRSKSILHFTRLPLALTLTARCSWLSSSVRAAPVEDDHVVDDALLHLLRPQLQVGVARKAHARRSGSCRAPTAPPHPPCTPARPDGSPLWT